MRKKINHRIRYSEKDFVEKNYMKDGKAVIPIKINKLDDLYMKNDYLKLDLSDHVFDYIEEVAYAIPSNVDIVLEVHYHDEISENQQKRIRKEYSIKASSIDNNLIDVFNKTNSLDETVCTPNVPVSIET